MQTASPETRPQLDDILPLTPLQEGLLFHALYETTGPDPYVIQNALDLSGPLDIAALDRAIQASLQRHANLRAVFRYTGVRQPVQIIPRHSVAPMRTLDWSDAASDEIGDRLRAWLQADRVERFDLRQSPLLRVTLIKTGASRHRLVLTAHHLILDGWSVPILIDEIRQLYAGAILPPVTPYRAYLEWIARQDASTAYQTWREVCAGLSEGTRLASMIERPLQAPTPDDSTSLWVTVPEPLVAALTKQCRAHGWTLNTAVQAAWGLVLARWSGRGDVVFGQTVSGRPPDVPGIETMVGLFINTVPVRLLVRGGDRLIDLLTQLHQQQARVAGAHYVSLAEIQRQAGVGDLFDTLLLVQNYPVPPDGTADTTKSLSVHSLEGHDATHYPLLVSVAQMGRQLRVHLQWQPGVFDRALATTIAARLERAFTAVAHDPTQSVATLDLLSDAERATALTHAQGELTTWTGPSTLPAWVAAQVARTPDAVAVVEGDQHVSYAVLAAHAQQLAWWLQAQAVGPETVVGVALERSTTMVTALLGVLTAGAAYLPLDPRYPAARLQAMVADARPRCVLGTIATAASLPAADVIALDAPEVASAIAAASPRPAPRLSAKHPAYVIYTSGSTGVPKGAVNPHGGVVNRLEWWQREVHLSERDRVLQKTPVSFDVSVGELFGPLGAGATLVLLAAGAQGDPRVVLDTIARAQVTAVHFVPSMLGPVLAAARPGEGRSLRRISCSGEALNAAAAIGCRRQWPEASLHNLYGPTEAAIEITAAAITEATEAAPPIGRPIANTEVYVLDAGLQPAPVGVRGDLYLGGVGVARGYHRRPGLTADRFVASPYGAPGTRLYRTGDIGHWAADGTVVYDGRADHQVKVRGFRVELGEVEAALRAQPGVQDAVVVAQLDAEGSQRLVGYITGADLDAAVVRRALAATLPDYLVPAVVMVLSALPLLPNGKIDRRALPAPDVSDQQAPYRAPRTPAEATLCTLFGDVLGVETVGVDDDFFALGGHSLMVMRLVSRIRAALDCDVAIRAVFDAPTPGALARTLSGAAAPPALTPQPRPARVPLSSAQQRLWVLYRLHPTAATYHIPHAVRLRGRLDRAALIAAFDDLLTRHEVLRTVFAEDDDGEPYQVVLDGASAIVNDIIASEETLGSVLTAAARQPFRLTEALPWRAHLVTLGAEEHVLLLVLHHLATDGWSTGPLWRDLASAYAARHAGRAPAWTPLPVQYADYALWQRAALGTEDDPASLLATQLAFWRSTLAALPPALPLPHDAAAIAADDEPGASVPLSLDRATLDALKAIGRRAQASLFMVVQAAVTAWLSRLGAGDDISLGTVIAGRTDHAVEEVIGFFVNTLVLRTDVHDRPAFTTLVSRARATALAAYAHADVPFERIVEDVQPARVWGRHPLFQVLLTVDAQASPLPVWPEVELTAERVELGVAQFDLAVNLQETPQGLTGGLTYRSDLFTRTSAAAMAMRFERLLAAVARDASQSIATIDLLSDVERADLLALGTGQAPAIETPPTLPAWIAAQVARTPDAIAVVEGDRHVSYAALGAQAQQLAWWLQSQGVGPETVVGVAIDRSTTLVTALLGVMAAGGAYLPLDPRYPAARLQAMVADAQPTCVLGTTATAAQLPDMPVIALDAPVVAAAIAAATPQPAPRLAGAHPAYVIYTSGSTGIPKGAPNTHAGIVNRLAWMQAAYQLDATDRVLQKTPASFDVSVWEFFWPLTHGATLVLLAAGAQGDPAIVLSTIDAAQVTTVHFVPSMLAPVLTAAAPREGRSLRRDRMQRRSAERRDGGVVSATVAGSAAAQPVRPDGSGSRRDGVPHRRSGARHAVDRAADLEHADICAR